MARYAKGWHKYVRISKQKLMQTKIWSIIFLWLWQSEDLSIAKILSDKGNMGGMGLISEKTEALYAELSESSEAVTSSYSPAGNFL